MSRPPASPCSSAPRPTRSPAGGVAATITVTRAGGSDGTVAVGFSTSDGSATAGTDYSAVSGLLTVGPGVVTQSFSVPILDDGGGRYHIVGDHTYLDEGSFPVSVLVTDGIASATLATTASIAEDPLPDGTRGTADQRFVSELYRDLL